MSKINEFEVRLFDGQIKFESVSPLCNVDQSTIRRYLEGARRYFRALNVADRLVNDCNYLVDVWADLKPKFTKYSELVRRKENGVAFQETFKDRLEFNFHRIFNMLEIKTKLKERIEDYRSMTLFIPSAVNILLISGLGVYLKDIGADDGESNYNLMYTRPTIFGELFPSYNESIEFKNWNADALKKMDAILNAEPSLDLLKEVMSINLPIFAKFRQDRITTSKFLEDLITKPIVTERDIGRYPRKNDTSTHTRTRDDHLTNTDKSKQTHYTDRSRWSERPIQSNQEFTQVYRPKRPNDTNDVNEYIPTSPIERPKNENNGWQIVTKTRKNARGK